MLPSRRARPLLGLLALIAAMTLSVPAHAELAADGSAQRLADTEDPVTAAIALSQSTFTPGAATHVVLGRDDVYADSLAGSALAGSAGPLLYGAGGPDGLLTDATLSEISRVLERRDDCDRPQVWLLGGEQAVSTGVVEQLDAEGHCVGRLAGPTRVETSVAIAAALPQGSGDGRVLLVSADGWADAATAGAYAAREGTPVLVTPSDVLAPAVAAQLAARRPAEIVLLGGTGVLSEGVAASAAAYGPVRRIAGPTRDTTATAIIDELFGPGPARGIILVDGYSESAWAFALAAAPVAARTDAALLYVDATGLSPATRRWLADHEYTSVTAVGSAWLVPETALRAAGADGDGSEPAVAPAAPAGGWPGAGNTGVPPGKVLRPSGRLTITRDGTVIDGLDVTGAINIKASNVTIRNTRISSSSYYLIRVYAGFRGTVIEDVELNGLGTAIASGISGSYLSVRRTDISGVGDGVKVGSNTRYEGNWIHDLARGGGVHPDGLQAQDARNIVIRGNTVDIPVTSGSNIGILLKGDSGTISDALLEGNLLNGGNVTLVLEGRGSRSNANFPVSRITVRNNLFGKDFRFREALVVNVTDLIWTGNRSIDGSSV